MLKLLWANTRSQKRPDMISATPTTIKTTCPYCGVGCGIDVKIEHGSELVVSGDKVHPANFGKLCVKGSALGETLGLEGRLLYPHIHGQRSTWNQAVGFIADGLKQTLERHGPNAVAFYLSGQLLTEDYYVANKFAKGFLGTPHVDTNSRLCMASSVAGHRRAFGADTVPNTYEDLDEADLIILVGSNAAWCHPVLFQRMQKAREKRGTRIVNIDPRRTATSEGADLQLSVHAGMDSVLFSWLLVELHRRGAMDHAYLEAHTLGLESALISAANIAPDLAIVAVKTGLSELDITTFTQWFITTERVVTCYSQGVNQSAQGSDKVNAILNCHLATARIGWLGSGPLSLTGQPNAMGGREVGGLANMLAAHMGYSPSEVDRVRRFWAAPNMAEREGFKAIQMFEAIERGEIKALWVMHTNPAVTLPRADAMRAALKKLDLFIVSEAMTQTDTTMAGAHVLLPATVWGEKNGTVTNSERRISRQRSFLPAPAETKADWEHITRVAQRMGFEEAFSFESPAAIFREHAILSDFENGGTRDFDIGATAKISDPDYDAMEPFHWPWVKGQKPRQRFFADGKFYTSDHRAKLLAIAEPALAAQVDPQFPFMLNTGRVRDHWHTMTRTGKAIRLARHVAEPTLTINPEDASVIGVCEGNFARIESNHGAATLRVNIDEGLPRGTVFAPFHWNDATSALARVDALVHAKTDPTSGQPELKATPVSVSMMAMACEGYLISRKRIALPDWLQHTRITIPCGEALLFASPRSPAALYPLLVNHLGEAQDRAEISDSSALDFRTVAFDGERLQAALFVGHKRDAATLDWLIESIAKETLTSAERKSVLAGRPPAGGEDLGPLVCSCFAVRHSVIQRAIRSGLTTVDQVGDQLKAGTNCGSCRPEIKRMIGLNIQLLPQP
jgi:assimilatory nitrate reductase catalytic subunit